MKLFRILRSSTLIVALLAVTNVSKAQTAVNLAVDFGTPPEGGGACTGKGLCTVKAASGEDGAAATSTVNVTFSLSSDRNILTLTFSKSELDMKQPGQSLYINSTASSYYFDGMADLSDPVFAPLGLKASPKIASGTPNTMSITGDVVTINYMYAHL